MEQTAKSFLKLVKTVRELRTACPWDRKQTIHSLRPLTLEETYELTEAIDNNDLQEIKKELGDLLLHIVFYAKIGEEKNAFTIQDVCDSIVEKLIARHPHVYGDVKAETEEAVKSNWEALKKKEQKGNEQSVLGGIPKALPPLTKAFRVQDKAAATGFDWDHEKDVWKKVQEEMNEFQEQLEKNNSPEKMEDELGDILFSLVNLARFKGMDADKALEKTNQKFISRFRWMEKKAAENNKQLSDMNIVELEELWQQAKQNI